MDKLEQIKQKIQDYQNKSAVTQDLKAFLTLVLGYIKVAKDDFSSISKDNLATISEALKYIETEHKGIMESVSQETKGVKEDFEKKLKEATDFLEEVKRIKLIKGDKGEDGLNGINPNPEDVVPFVLELLPEPKEVTGEEIADKLEALQGEAKLDFKALKNVPEFKGGKTGGVIARNIYQLGDVSLTSLANNDVLKWDDTNKLWVNGVGGGAGTIDGSGTANELPYWVDSNTLGTLAVATYPSLTELSYVKGLTSAIQTQINTKLSGNGTAGYVPYYSSSTVLTSEAHFNYNSTTHVLHVHGLAGDATDGLLLESDNGTDIAILGAANTANVSWYGNHNFGGTLIQPTVNDGASLGASLKSWSDLFLASGGVLNWNNGTYTITQNSTDLTFSGDIIFSNALTSTSDWDATAGGAMTFSALTTAGAGEAGKNVEFYAGGGGTGDTNGGIVKLKGGAKSGAGTDGYTYIVDPTSNLGAILNVASIASTDKTFTFPNSSGTIALTSDLSSYTPTSRTITIAGTANQITSSAGAQDLSANRTWTLSFPADVLIPTVLTVPNTGLHLLDTNASHDLIIAPGSDLTADHTLTLTTGDADRTITLSGNPTLSDWFDQSVKTTANPTFGNLTITSFAANWTNAGRTVADLGTITTADINGGTIDGVTIGGASAGAGTFTTVTVNTGVTLAENASIALDPAGSADGKYTGITVTGTGGAVIAFGDLVTLDKDDSRWELVDISVAAAATGDARGIIGMAVTSSTDGGAITVLLQGIIRADANFPALTIGAAVYASTTGDIVVTQPTTTDHVIRVVGYALTADEIYFNPENDWITHT